MACGWSHFNFQTRSGTKLVVVAPLLSVWLEHIYDGIPEETMNPSSLAAAAWRGCAQTFGRPRFLLPASTLKVGPAAAF